MGPGEPARSRPRRPFQARFWIGTAAASAAAVLIAELLIGLMYRDARDPHPSQSPGDVVRIQLGALSEQSGLDVDDGIAIAYRFASPANRAQVGPLEHFRMIVRAPAYRAMIGHRRAHYGAVSEQGIRALQEVLIIGRDGRSSRYLFQLTRQRSGPLAGCWLTDAVYPLDEADDQKFGGIEI